MSEPVGLTTGPSDTELPSPGPDAERRLADALGQPVERRRAALATLVRSFPEWSLAWAELGAVTDDDVEAYAYFRVGYHRGLDTLRRAGWRGSGYVRWSAPGNRGFLRCVEGLRLRSESIGESDEAQRCAQFLRQLDPSWPPADPAADG